MFLSLFLICFIIMLCLLCKLHSQTFNNYFFKFQLFLSVKYCSLTVLSVLATTTIPHDATLLKIDHRIQTSRGQHAEMTTSSKRFEPSVVTLPPPSRIIRRSFHGCSEEPSPKGLTSQSLKGNEKNIEIPKGMTLALEEKT